MTDTIPPAESLDDLVGRVDHERWLASRFIADETARADVIALYAFNLELARAAEVASQPIVGEMRLAWWSEVLDEIYGDRRVRGHPVARGIALAVSRRNLLRPPLEALIDGRLRDLDGWPLKPEEVEGYIDVTRGGLMRVAASMLAPESLPATVQAAALAWGLASLGRTPNRLPAQWSATEVKQKVREAARQANGDLRALPTAAFPAVAYAALAPPLASGRPLSELEKRVRLTGSILRGGI